jgi:hypothetical protein
MIDLIIRNRNKFKKNVVEIYYVCLPIVVFSFILCVYNSNRAHRVLNNIPEYNIRFTYNNKCISTNTDTVFLGRTEKYLFLRNNSKYSNLVYNVESIEFIEINRDTSSISANIKKHN